MCVCCHCLLFWCLYSHLFLCRDNFTQAEHLICHATEIHSGQWWWNCKGTQKHLFIFLCIAPLTYLHTILLPVTLFSICDRCTDSIQSSGFKGSSFIQTVWRGVAARAHSQSLLDLHRVHWGIDQSYQMESKFETWLTVLIKIPSAFPSNSNI